MLKTLTLALAIGAASTLLATDAGALPVAPGLQSHASSDVTLVREGCGPGRRYSERLRRCVEDRPLPVERRIERRIERAIIRHDCRPGWHWSPRVERCVRN